MRTLTTVALINPGTLLAHNWHITSLWASKEMHAATTVRIQGTQGGNMDERGQQHPSGDAGNKHGFVERVREQAGAQLATHKDSATEGMGTIAQAVRRTTAELRETKHETMAEYVEQAAVRLERWSEQLKHKDIGELLREAQNLARRQPVAFVGSAFALGLFGARFLKSRPPRHMVHSSGVSLQRQPMSTATGNMSTGRMTTGSM